ncbi:putative J-binding protein [Leptomonas pyrrhocoris]|uniref:Bifunctional helicase and thymine dioxygenase JBP2 n=1 Tax=Leptomonas pyrrhocoris TaxID=157538 RepID=A0A0N0DT95_LEPPY|nr:putative J-binding protein [Leptomonas pyrrhocoris]XP_015655580.1 putative J-binding protein [Leptomonas pyrrhocoris]KPA77140.1 putative J-binding protein [Leptomonas pyrrhocoris]KPA77141.1 putative J-binding protein [Leptomonas pyrrhocoris]|eukprot:XP_015655579.1 putative J-binding protein [Leptomonas pyrrhocoris]
MLRDLTRAGPTSELMATLDVVQTTGEVAIVFPSSSIGDLETITNETLRRQLRIAGIPRGGYTILPAIPLDDADLLNLCQQYCFCHEDEKAEIRGKLYLQHFPLFYRYISNEKPLYHPAEYVSRIIQFCFYYVQAPDNELPSLPERCPFLHISPVKEICSYLRCVFRGTTEVVPQADAEDTFSQSRMHAQEDVERVMENKPVTPPPLLQHLVASHADTVLRSPVAPDRLFHGSAVEDEVNEDEGGGEDEQLEDLTGEETVDAVRGSTAEYLTMDGFDLVTKTAIFFDCDGADKQVAAVYLPGSIPQAMCEAAAKVLEPAATKKNLRAATNGGVPPNTGIVGSYDYLNNPTQRKCRETEFSRRHWGDMSSCEPLFKHLDRLYSQMAPMHHHLQKAAIPTQYQLSGTVFSTVTVNRDFRTAVHTDKGDFRSGLGVLAVINGEFEGCHLAIKKIHKAFRLQMGDVLLFNTALEHGNTEVENPEAGWKRTSIVCYLRTGLMSAVCEMERRKHLNRLILQQLNNAAVRQAAMNINAGDPSLPSLFVPTRLVSQLAPVQLAAISFIVERGVRQSGCVVAMTMGLGKTLVALVVCFSHLYLAPKNDILIVTPKAILDHWIEEKNKWASFGLHFSHFVTSENPMSLSFEEQLLAYKKQKEREKSRFGHVFVINVEYLGNFLNRVKGFWPSIIIVDEGHRLASKESKLVKSLKDLKCSLHIALSGTPLQNSATELYDLVNFVEPRMGDVMPLKRFQELQNVINRFIEGDDSAFSAAATALEYVQEWMRGFVFREMENDLPPLHDYLLVCGSSDLQREYERKIGLSETSTKSLNAVDFRPAHLSTHPACYLAHIEKVYRSMAGDLSDRPPNRVVKVLETNLDEIDTMRLQQFVQMVDHEQLDSFINLSGKMRVLVDIVMRVQAKGEKLIVFSLHIGSQDLIHRTLTALRVTTFTVRGRDSQDRRRRAIHEFMSNDNLMVLVLSTKIAAYGLDFTAANHVVLFDSWWNPQVDAQAIGRAYRRNQTKPVTVYRLISVTENRSILRSQTRKVALFRSILHERISRSAMVHELEDCTESEQDEERREFWRKLKATQLAGALPALLNVYRYQEHVRETVE